MSHRNLPALNKYTSQAQYETLKEIDETKSIVNIVKDGRSSKTLGALIRSMWIKQKDYTSEDGVLREGWFVTEEGAHAMSIFAERDRIKQDYETKYRANVDKFEEVVIKYRHLVDTASPKLALLNEEVKQVEKEVDDTRQAVMSWACLVQPHDRDRIYQLHGLRRN